ncbi:MAG: hypothetical protein WC935_05145, partial [Thermoleophilia bacterium]
HGVSFDQSGRLDFSTLQSVGTQVRERIASLDSAAVPVSGVRLDPTVTEALTELQRVHLDHEAMTILGHEFKINDIERLRELRWTSHGSQTAHQLFSEQQRLIDELVIKGHRTFNFNGHTIDLDKLPLPAGASRLDRIRAALAEWAKIKGESINAADLAVHRAAGAAAEVVDTTPSPKPTGEVPQTPQESVATIRSETPSSGVQAIPDKTEAVVNLETPKTSADVAHIDQPAEPVAVLEQTPNTTDTVDALPAPTVPLEQVRQHIESISDTPVVQHDNVPQLDAPKPLEAPALPVTVTPVVPKTIEGPSVSTPNIDLSNVPPIEEAKPVE